MDVEPAMQFIVEQQAQLTASAQETRERIVALTASIEKRDAQIGTLTDLVGRLAQAEIRMVERMDRHETRLQSLEMKMTQFLERMDRFIQGLEGNGHKQP